MFTLTFDASAARNRTTCEDKWQMAVAWDSSTKLGTRGQAFVVKVLQKTGVRDWHFVLLSCGSVEAVELQLKIQAERGALSYFEANTHFDHSSCPVLPTSWWQQASSALGFWVMLLIVVVCSFCMAFFIGCSVRLCGLQEYTTTVDADVVGKPCEILHDENIAEGHPHHLTKEL